MFVPLSPPLTEDAENVDTSLNGNAVARLRAIAVFDTSTGMEIEGIPTNYAGPVAELQRQYIYSGADNVNISVSTGNWFLHGGTGNDALAVNAGRNVLDGGSGSNFLTGGSGTDTFFVDDRDPGFDIWSTVNEFHPGDTATIFGLNLNGAEIRWSDEEGAVGYTGLTLHASIPNHPTASLTLAGYSTADLSNGRLLVTFGNEPDGTPYIYILANQPSSGLWHDPSVSVVGSAGVDVAPRVAQPSQAGDIVGVRLQNTGSATEPSGYVSFGQVFLPGAVQAGESLVARINGVNYAVQMDVKSTNADGSVRQAVLTFNAPSIAAGGTVDLMLANGTGAGFSSTAPSASALLAAGYNVGVSFSFHNADGSMTTDSASAATALQAALNAGSVKSWLAGPGVNEYDVITTVDSGKLKVEFDIRAYADGTTRTDVIFDNGWMFAPGKTNLNYDVSINQGGQSLYSAAGVAQYLYSVWHHEVDSAGSVNPNIQYDVPYLMASGAIPAYDVSYGVSDAAIRTNYGALNPSSTGYGSTGPMGTAEVQPVMPTTGGRPDLATQPNWVAQWLLSQNASAESVMMANADASGGVPWHLTDESTGKPISELTYPLFYDDPRNVTGSPYYSPQPANGFPTYGQNGDPWRPQTAHMPDLNYVPYLVTGSNYQLELLQSAADFAITSMDPYYAFNLPNGANPTSPGSAVNLGLASYHNEDRAIAWGIREVAEAAYLTPDSDPLKEYFVSELNKTMNGLVQYYIIDNMNAQYGGIQGFLVGYNEIVGKSVPPWQQDYIVTALAEVAGMNLPQASDDAVQILKYMNNFVSGLYTNAQNGYNPVNGAAYYLTINDPTTGNPYTSWSQLAAGNASTYPPNATTFQHASWATDTQGGYAVVAKAALADEITYTKSAQAIQAYGFLITQIAVIWNDPVKEAAAYETSPMWSVMPRLPDGVYLSSTQMQIDTSGSSVVNLTATGGDSLLSVAGNGTARLTGGTGTCDLLFGGSGPTTLAAGTGNDYLFGGSASNTFVDNTGNNYMQGAGTGNLFVFEENNSGHDVIANFNVSSDRLQIGANLNGDGFTTAAQLLAAATIVNGNTVLHLSPNDDITLFGITQPTKLANSILFR